MKWEPIETAPRDGTYLVFWVISASGHPYWDAGSWSLSAGGWVDERGDAYGPLQSITHYLIPEPPQ